jgi:hypothetical protein
MDDADCDKGAQEPQVSIKTTHCHVGDEEIDKGAIVLNFTDEFVKETAHVIANYGCPYDYQNGVNYKAYDKVLHGALDEPFRLLYTLAFIRAKGIETTDDEKCRHGKTIHLCQGSACANCVQSYHKQTQ